MTSNLYPAIRNKPIVLLIEDNAEFNIFASTVLRQEGYEILVAGDGATGVALAEEHLPDLIICDVMMPRMDGHAVLQKLRSQLQTATIPFIFMTALATQENLRDGMVLGADDYLSKPVRPKELLRAVEVRLRRNQQTRLELYEWFSQQVMQAQENERESTAKLLHERVNQALVSLKLSLSLLETGSTKSDPVLSDAQAQLDTLVTLVEDTAQKLHSTVLMDLDLVSAVRWLVGQYELDVTFTANNMDYQFDHEVEIAAFRILQLALDNAAARARTRTVSIDLAYRNARLDLKIEDSGVDYLLEAATQSKQNLNLLSIVQRAAIVGGQVQIRSNPDHGTVILAQLPQSDSTRQPQPISRSVLSSSLGHEQTPSVSQTTTENETRVVVAVEPLVQRQGLCRLLRSSPNVKLIAEVDKLDEAAEVVKKHRPDVLILNPVSDGKKQRNILQSIVAIAPEARILVMASQTSTEYVVSAIQNHALGYIPVNATMTDLNTAITHVARGQMYLSPVIKQQEVLAKLMPVTAV